MNERTRTVLAILLALMLALAALGIAGCNTGSDDSTATDNDEAATQDEPDEDTGESETPATDLTEEQADAAADIARAYFVAQTDFTGDQFTWTVEAAAQDDEGTWWARVSANPNDNSLETEQVYVYSSAGSDFWFAHDMGTGIDPATDESFPEEVRDQLGF